MERLRDLIEGPDLTIAPVALNPLMARMAVEAGFKAVYMSGGSLGWVKCGTEAAVTLPEMAALAMEMRTVSDVPVILDAGGGWGDPAHIHRTIRMAEAAGFEAVEIEDQLLPRRFHHHVGVEHLVPTEFMAAKISEAVAARKNPDLIIVGRTNALRIGDMDEALARAEAYREAGADMLFVEAVRTPEQAESLPGMFDVPLVYNYVETGKSPLLPVDELARMGYKMVIYPASALLTATKAVIDVVRVLRADGGTEDLIEDRMVSLIDCFEVAGLTGMLATDARFASAET